uniref:TNF alpha induced protein 2 n=1 Tax=Terrapene triunguis TaxID=2587831 RepID=A0A674JPG9_9SAUR
CGRLVQERLIPQLAARSLFLRACPQARHRMKNQFSLRFFYRGIFVEKMGALVVKQLGTNIVVLLTVEQIREHLESDQFFNANQQLIALEWALYNNIGDKSEEELSREQSKVESLYELLKCKVFSIIKNSIILAPANPKLLRHAVYAIEEQEVADEKYKSEKPSDKIVSYRPRKWKEVWMDTVKQSVADRMKDIQRTSPAENLPTTALCFLHMGRTMKEDMITVVECIKQHYHAQFNVCSTYAECYHSYFSSQLQLIAEFELGDKDVYLLLTWVQNLYPNDIRKNSILVKELDEAKLGSLLPPKMIKQLEVKYLYNEANWLAKSLEMEVQRWTEEREPEKLDGHFHSELAIDVIQVQSQSVAGNSFISATLTSSCKVTDHDFFFQSLPFSYQKALEEFKEKNKQHSYFKAMIIANINNYTLCQTSGIICSPRSGFHAYDPTELTPISPPQQGIMEKIHGHLVREYIVRLMKKKVSLKTPELQQNLSNLISAHASHLQSFCKEKGSKATWLDSALPNLAEIIRLQDSNSIKIEVATLANTYPDISKKHLAAILYIKGNLSSSEVRSILNILDVSTKSTTSCESLFSAIKIS